MLNEERNIKEINFQDKNEKLKCRVIDTPSQTEFFIALNEPEGQMDLRGTKRAKKRTFDELLVKEKALSVKRKQKYYKDVRYKIKRLVDCNFNDRSIFLTLTFKENLQDIEKANYLFKKFILRLKYFLNKQGKKEPLKYVAVWERQKRGAVHYHLVVFDIDYIKAAKIEELWGHGFIKVNLIRGKVAPERIGLYISKYFAKDFEVKDNLKKAFFTSKNLKKPEVEDIDMYPDEVQELLKNASFSKTYDKFYFNVFAENFKDHLGQWLYVVVDKRQPKNIGVA